MQGTGFSVKILCPVVKFFPYQLTTLTVKKRCFGAWPKQRHIKFFKEDYYV